MAPLRRTESTDGGIVHASAGSGNIDASDEITMTLIDYRGLSEEGICTTTASRNFTRGF
jgi:hypothetical protein